MRCPTWFVIGILNLCAVSAADAVDRIEGVQIVPRNNGVSRPALAPVIPGATIVGNEIRLPKGGVTVELEFIVSGWENAGNGLNAVVYPVDLSSLEGANATPANPGINLIPIGYPGNHVLGAFITLRVCNNSGRDCATGLPPCSGIEGICVPNNRFVFIPEKPAPAIQVNFFPELYEFNTAVGVCLPDPGIGADPLDYGYFGTMLLSVPSTAVGAYNIEPFSGLIDTAYFSPAWAAGGCPSVPALFPPIALGATITILDCDQDGTSDGQEIDDGTAEDCNDNFVPDECESLVDGDGDGAPDVCDGCPNDAMKTQPGVCGCNISEQDLDQNGTPDCVDVIPAASTWGLLVLALVLLAGAKVVFTRRTVRTG